MAYIRGETDRFIQNVRYHMGDTTGTLVTDDKIVAIGNRVQDAIFLDVLHPANKGYGDYYSVISYVADQEYYALPHGFLRLNEASMLDSSGLKLYDLDVIRRDEKHMYPGVFLEQNQLGVAGIPPSSETNALKLHYTRKPVPIHKSVAAAYDATSITFAANPIVGEIVTRNGAYLGTRVQALNSTTNEGEVATVTAYVGSTRVATLAWDSLPTGTLTYEILPDLPTEAQDLWELETAWRCLRSEGAGAVSLLTMLQVDVRQARASLLHAAHTRINEITRPL